MADERNSTAVTEPIATDHPIILILVRRGSSIRPSPGWSRTREFLGPVCRMSFIWRYRTGFRLDRTAAPFARRVGGRVVGEAGAERRGPGPLAARLPLVALWGRIGAFDGHGHESSKVLGGIVGCHAIHDRCVSRGGGGGASIAGHTSPPPLTGRERPVRLSKSMA